MMKVKEEIDKNPQWKGGLLTPPTHIGKQRVGRRSESWIISSFAPLLDVRITLSGDRVSYDNSSSKAAANTVAGAAVFTFEPDLTGPTQKAPNCGQFYVVCGAVVVRNKYLVSSRSRTVHTDEWRRKNSRQ